MSEPSDIVAPDMWPGGAAYPYHLHPDELRLVVESVADENLTVRRIVLAAPDGCALPAPEPGAHLRVHLPGDYDDRHYSLVVLPQFEGRYTLGVRLDEHSRGGSRFMHNLMPGDRVWVSHPRQSFALHDLADETPTLLVAGGIGITPLASMAAALAEADRPFALHYAARHEGAFAFRAELEALCGRRLHLHRDDAARLDLAAVVGAADPAGHLYVCGPAPMIEAAREAARAAGFRDERVRFELFAAPASEREDKPFEIELASTGDVLAVPADRSALAVLREAGLAPDFDCERGGCGMCRVGVLAGEPDHRDVILSARERAANDAMQVCVSRALTPRLVLDL